MTEVNDRTRVTSLQEQLLVAVLPRWKHVLDVHGVIPVVGGRHCSAISAEADQHRLIAVRCAAQLA